MTLPLLYLSRNSSDDGLTAQLRTRAADVAPGDGDSEDGPNLRTSYATRKGSFRKQRELGNDDEGNASGTAIVDYVSNKAVEEVLRLARWVSRAICVGSAKKRKKRRQSSDAGRLCLEAAPVRQSLELSLSTKIGNVRTSVGRSRRVFPKWIPLDRASKPGQNTLNKWAARPTYVPRVGRLTSGLLTCCCRCHLTRAILAVDHLAQVRATAAIKGRGQCKCRRFKCVCKLD